jgi:hypothetical protein
MTLMILDSVGMEKVNGVHQKGMKWSVFQQIPQSELVLSVSQMEHLPTQPQFQSIQLVLTLEPKSPIILGYSTKHDEQH